MPKQKPLFRRAAYYVDRILESDKPGDVSTAASHQFELAINLRTAESLGLTVPPSLRARADQVME